MNCNCRISIALNKLRTAATISLVSASLTLSIALMVVVVLEAHAVTLPPLTHSLIAVAPPEAAPTLVLQNLDEETVDIGTLHGKTIVVNFWATWCPPCRREMTSLERLYQATKDSNVVVLAINVGEDMDTAFSFINSIEPSPSFPILFDTDSSTMQRWKVRGLPTTYVIGPDGKIAYRAIGGREFDHPDVFEAVVGLNKIQPK